MMDGLFRSVFNNVVLLKSIYQHVRLFQKNKSKTFKDVKSLRKYQERDYIQKLVYRGQDSLEFCDLPSTPYCVLKEVYVYSSELTNGNLIPYGVEVLVLGSNSLFDISLLPTLPSTIETIENINAAIAKEGQNYIPPNIKSISFSRKCTNISNNNENGNGFIKIPNTIKELKFDYEWHNEEIPLRPNDIPFGITSLEMFDTPFGKGVLPDSLTKFNTSCDLDNIDELVFPNSIKHLEIRCEGYDDIENDYGYGLFNFLPTSLESLYVRCNCSITPDSNLTKFNSIINLTIEINEDGENDIIEPNSIPSSVTELELIGILNEIQVNTIPNSVTKLSLTLNEDATISENAIPNSVTSLTLNRIIEQPNILPQSLTSLEVEPFHYYQNFNLSNMVSILPQSLISISLPISFKQLNVTFPPTIKIDYK